MLSKLQKLLVALVCAFTVAACGTANGTDARTATGGESDGAEVVETFGLLLEVPPPVAVDDIFEDEQLDLVVRGTVTAVDHHYAQETATTQLTVTVEGSDRDAPAVIKAWEMGGDVPVDEYSEAGRDGQGQEFVDRDDLPEDAVVRFGPAFGAEQAKVGDEVVLLLRRIEGGAHAGDYNVASDTFGRFTRMSDGTYVRAGVAEGSTIHDVLVSDVVAEHLS